MTGRSPIACKQSARNQSALWPLRATGNLWLRFRSCKMEWNSQRSVVQRPPFRSTTYPLATYTFAVTAIDPANRGSALSLTVKMPDNTAPSWRTESGDLREFRGRSAGWSTATDEGNLAGYRIYRDTLVGETEAITRNWWSQPTRGGCCSLAREAFDEAGNESFGGPQLSTTSTIWKGRNGPSSPRSNFRGDDPFRCDYMG